MCGIAGFIDPKITSLEERHKLIDRMLEKQHHRGPDNRGEWHHEALTLGHNRLSIIDLSEAGHQPFHYGPYHITFNGEIYNYRELKIELETLGLTFSTSSDTEVICAAYQAWGEECVKRFMGMWAFALWDEKNQKLFCSRDRFGIKPFLYQQEGAQFYFASEYKTLKESPLFKGEWNHNQFYRFLQLGWLTYEDETFYQHIKALPEAHNLVYQNGQLHTYRYWDLSLEQQKIDFQEATEEWRRLFTRSIEQHMRADTPVGACLSGGLDSSAICSKVGLDYADTAFKTFTIYYEGKGKVDERPWAQMVTDRFSQLDPYTYSPKEDELLSEFERFFEQFDVPPAGSSPLSQYFVMRLAKSHGMKVLLDGQGADEYLAGYDHSFYRLAAGQLLAGNPLGFFKELQGFQSLRPKSIAKQFGNYAKSALAAIRSENELYRLEFTSFYPYLGAETPAGPYLHQPSGGSRLNQFLYQLTMRSSLPSLLHNEDRNSMAFSIESRVPFLDHRLVEFSFSLPDQHKLHLGWSKRVLREAMRGTMPESIIDRKDKKGFVTPGESQWLRGPFAYMLDEVLAADWPFLKKDKVKEVVESYRAGSDKNARLVWRLAMLNKWLH